MSLGQFLPRFPVCFSPTGFFPTRFSLAAPQTIMFASGCSALDLFDLNELELR